MGCIISKVGEKVKGKSQEVPRKLQKVQKAKKAWMARRAQGARKARKTEKTRNMQDMVATEEPILTEKELYAVLSRQLRPKPASMLAPDIPLFGITPNTMQPSAPRIMSPSLRRSASFTVANATMSEKPQPSRIADAPSSASKRYSDESKELKGPGVLRKKSGFSGLMSTLGLPKEWQRLINESGIPENAQRENPQMIADIVTFYKETAERPHEDQVLEKFHDVRAPELRTPSGGMVTSPGIYSPNLAGMSPMISPPASPRFPIVNNEGTFENPRAPPPVPVPGKSPVLHTARDHPNLQPSRPAPKPPVSMQTRIQPQPQTQPQYPAKDSGIGRGRTLVSMDPRPTALTLPKLLLASPLRRCRLHTSNS
ncbi:hypothetical protein NUW58_g2979 [Xylaria curta]|uniref:Uncharacterized protein n=1 Tax=Xylaria curta TaxID=42375 RepID=A0ACC1PD40_9PEZI|nr:hypothetical protein NUW58_g2979 [Xylaria curta]